jgi:hypothetical protein
LIIPFSLDVSGDRFVQSGTWDSIHVIEAVETGSKTNTTTYKLTTTIMLHISIDKVQLGKTMLSGSLTRQVTIITITITFIIIISIIITTIIVIIIITTIVISAIYLKC